MNILLTNISMAGISGTEQYTRTLAVALAARGHGVEVFAPMAPGHSVVPAFRGIKVVHSIDEVGFLPDILHCHHLPCAMEVLTKWPQTPSLFVVHDATVWHDALPPVESLDAIVAVDQRCAERAAREAQGASIEIIPNPIESQRIPLTLRRRKPRSLLIYGKSGGKTSWNRHLRLAALTRGIWRFRVLQDSQNPQSELARYDVVMARARCAMEACMSGAYTLLFDRGVSGGAVTPDRVEHLQKWNFGRGVLNETLTLHRFKELLANYSRDEALSAGRMLRPLVNPALIGGRFEILYQQCITARGQRGTPGSSHAEKMRFVQSLMKPMLYPQENFPSSRRFRERQISAAPDQDSPRQK